MEKRKHVTAACCLLVASMALFSCKKEMTENTADAAAGKAAVASQALAQTTCKPEIFAAYNEGANLWRTFAQKWYEGGRVKNLKASIGQPGNGFPPQPFFIPLILTWSDITYQGNEVRLVQQPQNHLLMRVVLNAQGLPEAYYYHSIASQGQYYKDTSYLYYTGTRLDSMVSIVEYALTATSTPVHRVTKAKFTYDAQGNLSVVDFPYLSPQGDDDGDMITFTYDLSKPITGMLVNHNISVSFRLLEAMELITLPMHYAVTGFDSFRYNRQPNGNIERTLIYAENDYTDHVIVDGLVQSYVQTGGSNRITFYMGWNCNAASARQKSAMPSPGINSLEQFRQAFPQAVKR